MKPDYLHYFDTHEKSFAGKITKSA